MLTQTNRLHHFDCQVVKKIFKSVRKQSNWPAILSASLLSPTVPCLLISLAHVLEAGTFACQMTLSFSRKLNEIAVTSYEFTSLTLCVRLSNQLRKILIFFSLWNYRLAGWIPNSVSSYRHLVFKIGLSSPLQRKCQSSTGSKKQVFFTGLYRRLIWASVFRFGATTQLTWYLCFDRISHYWEKWFSLKTMLKT